MKNLSEMQEMRGWQVSFVPCDYAKFARETEREMNSIKAKIDALNAIPQGVGEKEMKRRKSVRILTDMYYEQRSNLILFKKRLGEPLK